MYKQNSSYRKRQTNRVRTTSFWSSGPECTEGEAAGTPVTDALSDKPRCSRHIPPYICLSSDDEECGREGVDGGDISSGVRWPV